MGYDDLTAIDWIFEYAKERQRLRYLYSSATGVLGYIKQLADASQIWLILLGAGLMTGGVAAFIDVASDWLGDLKTGYCSHVDGDVVDGDGKFYLNKGFCCWGYSEYSQCHDWHPWSNALGVTSRGGSWIIEYIFFVVFSVSSLFFRHFLTYTNAHRFCLRHVLVSWFANFQRTQSIAVSLRSRLFLVASSFGVFWVLGPCLLRHWV